MNTDEFFARHNFKTVMITDALVKEMTDAFTQDKATKDRGRGPDMFRTWKAVPEKIPSDTKIIVIDAGGTNFRSCLVTTGRDGRFSVSDFRKTHPDQIAGILYMNQLKEYQSKGYGFIAQTDPLLATILKIERDRTGEATSAAANETLSILNTMTEKVEEADDSKSAE